MKNLKFVIPYSIIIIFSLLLFTSCDKNDENEPKIEGNWELIQITDSENKILTEEFWGSIFWDFDFSKETLEVFVDYSIIFDNNQENDDLNGFFIGMEEGTYKLNLIDSRESKKIEVGDRSKGFYILNNNKLILHLNYTNGEYSSSNIYYFTR